VDWCGNSLYGRSGDSAWCNGYSTKGRLVLREFGNCAWPRAALESSSGFRPPRCRLIDEKDPRGWGSSPSNRLQRHSTLGRLALEVKILWIQVSRLLETLSSLP
jgi:hypothetical protein